MMDKVQKHDSFKDIKIQSTDMKLLRSKYEIQRELKIYSKKTK
jgi:hypothetical protein